MADEETAGEQKAKKGYGKRPLWQWLLVYVVIGVIIYGLIYYFVLAKKGSYNSNYKSPATQQQNY